MLFAAALLARASADDSAAVKKVFADPPRQYASAPLWVWNDMLTEEQVRGTLRDLAGQKVKQAFVHPRPGLMTPYLSDEWFRLWRIALDEAEKLDMNIWIYDENSYPSGFAGGWVPELMPESRGRGLAFKTEKKPGKPGPEVVGVYRLAKDAAENVTDKAQSGSLPEGQYLVASVVRAGNSPWHGDRCYVDLMYPGVTQKFLEVTLDAYKKHIGDQFGKRVLGSFTDEPNIRPAGGLPWTDDLPQVFEKRWGYRLTDHLASLHQPVGDWKKIRHDYYAVLVQLFIERWAKPYYDWCEKNGIAFTGHYWDHEWPNCGGVPDNMAMYAWEHIPGIDCLMNQYREDTHAQFGNARMVKEVASVANQLGRKRVLCELYGAGGWDLRFEDMKRIGDWLEVLGVNLLDEHLSYVTLRGARKADHPQSFSYHEPWWDSYHVVAGYFTRVTAALTHGQQINRVLVIEPTTTAWMYQGASVPASRLGEIGKSFFDFVMDLEQAQVEYDLGCEDVIARHGKSRQLWTAPPGPKPGPFDLFVGNRRYDLVVLPPGTETLDEATVRWLEPYVWHGGRVLCCGPVPAMVDGRPSDRIQKLAENRGWKQCEPAEAVRLAAEFSAGFGMKFRRAEGDQGILFHHRRELRDGHLLFLVNTSIEHHSRGAIECQAKGIEQWCCHTGKVLPYALTTKGEVVQAGFDLPPSGSLLLFFSNEPRKPAPVPQAAQGQPLAPTGPMQIRRIEPNVLTLDYLDVTAGGQTRKDCYFHRANQFAFQKNGMERNPWDSAVQFKDELIRKKFPADSGFEATYRFTIAERVPEPLWIVIERPDLYTITCNGKPVPATKDWWLDRSFGKLDISRLAQVGENAVTLRAGPFTIYHEIEPAYVLGDFSLKPAQKGFIIHPPRPLTIAGGTTHGTDLEGMMWLSAGIGYHRDASKKEGNDGQPSIVFDLGKPVDLAAIEVFNYNEPRLTSRGVKKMLVATASSADANDLTPAGEFELAQAPGAKTPFGQKLTVKAHGVRTVSFVIRSNHAGVTYPTTDGGVDNAFVGLSEVRFYAANGTLVPGVKIAKVSSELTSNNHDRRAVHLVDGSGLGMGGLGWNQQGHPFYAAGVSYRQTFDVPKPKGQYVVTVLHWYGSVAKVLVNGKLVGHLVSPPWECDVTEAIQPGANTVEVVVIGTLKNTLGPHHAGSVLGSAWPGMFHQGPQLGPPPGAAYHTVGYGLFAPFEVKQVAP
jgi:hypothetical protein